MISNISFGSTYKVSSKNNGFDKFWKFQSYALNKERYEDVGVQLQEERSYKFPYEYSAQYTLIAPDSMDKEIETYCANFGIEFRKYLTNELSEHSSILSRIQDKNGYNKTLAYVDVEKLENLIKTQDSNIKHCQKDYNCFYRYAVDTMIKSGEEFPTTTLEIVNPNCTTEETVDYIKKYGAEYLNKNQLFVDFNQLTDNPDHCVYFALRDLGMNKVPVYVSKDTRAIGNALGIFE